MAVLSLSSPGLSLSTLAAGFSLILRILVLLGQVPTLMTSLKLNDPLNAPSPNKVMLGVRVSPYEFGGNNPVHSSSQCAPDLRFLHPPSPTRGLFSLHLNFIPYKGISVMLSI